MSFTLGAVTLPNPKSFTREFIELAHKNTTIEGTAKKRVTARKERFTLVFQNLTEAQLNSIMSEYDLNQVRTFTVNETNLTINATDVLIDIPNRDYGVTGPSYRGDLNVILTEVS